jgi:hypothetical protein
MSSVRTIRKLALAIGILAPLVVADQWSGGQFTSGALFSEAQARVGRPLTPGSVAGVARRTTRRTLRRSAIYVGTLPSGCVRTTVSGYAVWRCGGTYYQSSGGRYAVVYID